MAFRTTQVTVGDTPTLLLEAQAGDLEVRLDVDQTGAGWYVGGSDVTATSGYRLSGSSEFHSEIRPGDEIYGIVPSGFVFVNVLVRSA
jgi:hypothetical protein